MENEKWKMTISKRRKPGVPDGVQYHDIVDTFLS